MSEELKPERPIAELQAGNDFRDSLISRADANVFGSAPLWHGWAIMDAFLAGIDYARRPSPPVVDGELPSIESIVSIIDFAAEARGLKNAVSASAYPSTDGGADIDNHALPQIEITLRDVAERVAAKALSRAALPYGGEAVSDLNELSRICHEANIRWWRDPATGATLERNKGELLCLIHSEISEAMEGERKGLMDDKLPHRKMAEVELADALIRIFDYAGAFGYDLQGAFTEKMTFNAEREDHKAESRLRAGGKKW